MAEVGDVAPRAETLQHPLHNVWNLFLKEEHSEKETFLDQLEEDTLCSNGVGEEQSEELLVTSSKLPYSV